MLSSFSNSTKLSQYVKPVIVVPSFPTGTQVIGKAGLTFPTTSTSISKVTVTNLNYGDGAYYATGEFIATSSSSFSSAYSAGMSFNYNNTTTMWGSKQSYSAGVLTHANGGYAITSISGTAYNGEWLQIQCPFSFIMKTWSCGPHIATNTEYAKRIYILGSTNGTTWNLLTTIQATAYNNNSTILSNTTPYNYYRFIVNEMTTSASIASMSLITFSS